MKHFFTCLLITLHCLASAQIVNIPDDVFKNYLTSNPLINTNNDNEIQLSEAINITRVHLLNLDIDSLTGIETFSNLDYLYCKNTHISNLDVSNNSNLDYLRIDGASFETIILDNASLSELYILYTNIDSINLDLCTNLERVKIIENSSLSYFSIKNGQNQYLLDLSSYHNFNLYCIKIDDVSLPTMRKDYWTEFNTNCPDENCISHSFHILPLMCGYGIDSIIPYHVTIDTFTNSMGCDSFQIIQYTDQLYDSESRYDSIFLEDTLGDFLKPILSYSISNMGNSFYGPYYRYFTNKFYDFKWYHNDELIIGATDSVYTPIETGFYKVEITDTLYNDLCKVFSLPYFKHSPTAINDIEHSLVNVYPNPFNDFIEIKSSSSKEFYIIIYDILGKELLKNRTEESQKIDLKEFDSGVYFLQIIDSDTEQIIKKIKLIKN